jgi:hypothetical protein
METNKYLLRFGMDKLCLLKYDLVNLHLRPTTAKIHTLLDAAPILPKQSDIARLKADYGEV